MKLKSDLDVLEVGDIALRNNIDPKIDDYDDRMAIRSGHPYLGIKISKIREMGSLTELYVVWGRGPFTPRRLPMNKIFSKPLPLP